MLQARFFYRTESGDLWPDTAGNPTEKRRLTFAYTCNKETGEIQFGATVHRASDPKCSYKKAAHREAALGRLVVRPRIFHVAPGTRYTEIEEEIRYQMRFGGAGGNRLQNPRNLEVVETPETITYMVSED